MATTLGFLILARVVQGAAGRGIQPLSQAILMESFPPAKRGVAMATFGMGVVVAPIIGPVLGGWITDSYSWRWIFYINIPIGIIAVLMCQAFVEDPPYLRAAHQRRGGQIDYIGFGVMALWLATLQIILDRGQQDDWLSAVWIRWASGISLASMILFVLWELRIPHPLVNLRVMTNRNFAIGTLLITVVGIVLYSTTALLPLFLQSLMGYPAFNSGMAISPRGMGAIVSLLIVGRLVGMVDTRLLVASAFCLLAYACWVFGRINLDVGTGSVMWPNILSGMAMAGVFVPLTTASMGSLPKEEMGNAAGYVQPRAKHRRRHGHLANDHFGCPRNASPSGLDGRPPQPFQARVPTVSAIDDRSPRPVQRSGERTAESLRAAIRHDAATGQSLRLCRYVSLVGAVVSGVRADRAVAEECESPPRPVAAH